MAKTIPAFTTITGFALCTLIALTLISGCARNKVNTPPLVSNSTDLPNGQPSHITVQHILIGFEGTLQGKDIMRSRQEAEQLANDLLNRANSGENFPKLVEEFTDDAAPGIYHMANFGQPSNMHAADEAARVFPRNGMVDAFGDVGFPLKVGEVGMSQYDRDSSPFGWHIVKRLK